MIVTAGATIYTMSLTRPVQVRSYVSEPHLGEVAPGTAITLWTDGDPDRRYSGRIGFVSPVASVLEAEHGGALKLTESDVEELFTAA